jgi:hypothetical protein
MVQRGSLESARRRFCQPAAPRPAAIPPVVAQAFRMAQFSIMNL